MSKPYQKNSGKLRNDIPIGGVQDSINGASAVAYILVGSNEGLHTRLQPEYFFTTTAV
jgi:hypothetical protein